MSVTLAQLRSQVKTDYQFGGVTDASIDRALNARYREMVAEAEFLRKSVAVGDTVADQRSYALADGVEAVLLVTVDGTPYRPLGALDMAELAADVRFGFGWFGESTDENGGLFLDLHPTPTEAGLAIVAVCALLPAALADDGDVIVVPDDFGDGIADGAAATLMRRVEGRLADADALEARFQGEIARLRRRRMRRVQGGPVQIQVAGRHF